MRRTKVPAKADHIKVYSRNTDGSVDYNHGYLRKMRLAEGYPIIYFLMSNGEVIYVGRTISLLARLYNHVRDGKVFDTVYYVFVSDYVARERFYINAFDPELNKKPGCPKLRPDEERTPAGSWIDKQLY